MFTPFSGPTACQGVPCFTASICLFPQLFKYMKIAYFYQTGSYAHLDLFIVEWSKKRKTALISGEPGGFNTNTPAITPSLPQINKRKATSDPGTFRHAGSGRAAVPPALSITNKQLPTVVSTLPFSLWLYHAENPEPCWIFYLLPQFYIAGCSGLLSVLTCQCIYSRAGKLCPQLRLHGLPTCGGKVLGTNSVFAPNSQPSSASTW